MTTYNHTAIAVGAAGNAATFNAPLAELDAAIKKNEYAKTAAPGVGDDAADGYTVGSVWIDTTNDRVYVCVDATAGAAKWRDVELAMVLRLTASDFQATDPTPAATNVGNATYDGGIGWAFDDAAIEAVGGWFIVPASGSGSTITIKLYYTMASATADKVLWTIYCDLLVDGEATGAAGATANANPTVPGTAGLLDVVTADAISHAWEEGDLMRLCISRVGSNGTYDTASGDAYLLAVEVIFS